MVELNGSKHWGNRNFILMVESLFITSEKGVQTPPPQQYCFQDLPALGENNQDSSNFGELQGQLETATRKSKQLRMVPEQWPTGRNPAL